MLAYFYASFLHPMIPAQAESVGTPVKPLDSLTIASKACQFGGVCARIKPETIHTGVDYQASAGTPVYAVCDGKVREDASKREDIWSRFLIIEHTNCGGKSDLYSYYGHIDSVIGGKGTKVTKGQQIATVKYWLVSNKGKSYDNSHLHFGTSTSYMNPWGYQVGDRSKLLQKGWLDPQEFLSQASNSPVAKQPTSTSTFRNQQRPASQPKPRDDKGTFKLKANIDRKQLNTQEICDTWIRKSYSTDRIILSVQHVIKRDQLNARVHHSCSFQYRLKPPGSLIHGFSLSEYIKPRKEEETSLENIMYQACNIKFGNGYVMKHGKYGSTVEGEVYCEKNLGWIKVY